MAGTNVGTLFLQAHAAEERSCLPHDGWAPPRQASQPLVPQRRQRHRVRQSGPLLFSVSIDPLPYFPLTVPSPVPRGASCRARRALPRRGPGPPRPPLPRQTSLPRRAVLRCASAPPRSASALERERNIEIEIPRQAARSAKHPSSPAGAIPGDAMPALSSPARKPGLLLCTAVLFACRFCRAFQPAFFASAYSPCGRRTETSTHLTAARRLQRAGQPRDTALKLLARPPVTPSLAQPWATQCGQRRRRWP